MCSESVKNERGDHKYYTNYLTIDLLEPYTISMIKISDKQIDGDLNKLTELSLFVSKDGVNFNPYEVSCLHDFKLELPYSLKIYRNRLTENCKI